MFASEIPPGIAYLRFVRGQREGEDALVWELSVQSTDEETPQDENALMTWASSAHDLIEYWFFNMLDEELLAEFE
jgi:uncharacterized protein (TIGR04255 family)